MADTKNLLPEEVQSLKELRDNYNGVLINLGIVQTQIAELENKREDIYSAIDELRKKEDEFFKSLREKYGEGTIDLNTGLFTKEG